MGDKVSHRVFVTDFGQIDVENVLARLSDDQEARELVEALCDEVETLKGNDVERTMVSEFLNRFRANFFGSGPHNA